MGWSSPSLHYRELEQLPSMRYIVITEGDAFSRRERIVTNSDNGNPPIDAGDGRTNK